MTSGNKNKKPGTKQKINGLYGIKAECFNVGIPNVNFNGKKSDNKKVEIQCRHLSGLFLFANISKERRYINQLSMFFSPTSNGANTVESCNDVVRDFLQKNIFDSHRVLYRADEYKIFKIGQIGDAVYSIFTKMGEVDKNKILFCSEHHTMAIELIKKTNPKRFVIKFYDPNRTTMHKRVVFDQLADVKDLKPSDFLSAECLKAYFPKFNFGVFGVYKNPTEIVNLSPEKTPKEVELIGSLDGCSEDDLSAMIHSSCSLNFPILLTKCCNKIISSTSLLKGKEAERVASLLVAKRSDGTSGLYLALQNGHVEVIKAYLAAILSCEYYKRKENQGALAALLVAKDAYGTPGLFKALQNNHAEAIHAYLVAILNCEYYKRQENQAALAALLVAKDAKGVPGLMCALFNGNASAVKVYLAAIINCDHYKKQCNQAELVALVAAKRSDGTPGLYWALQNGHAEAIKEYLAAILNCAYYKDNPKELMELLVAKRSDGIAGLLMALQNGHAEAVKVYMSTICDYYKSRPDDMSKSLVFVKLLAAENLDGNSVLYAALEKGAVAEVKIYLDAVLESNALTNDQKFKLLMFAVKNKKGVSGVLLAAQKGHTKVVECYKNTILKYDFSVQQKTELLVDITNDKTLANYSGAIFSAKTPILLANHCGNGMSIANGTEHKKLLLTVTL